MISIIIDIDDIEISMTAEQAIRLRDELIRLTGYRAPEPVLGWPTTDQWRFKPVTWQPYTGDWTAAELRSASVTVRQNGLEFPA